MGRKIFWAILIASLLFLAVGAYHREFSEIYANAKYICLSCVGIE